MAIDGTYRGKAKSAFGGATECELTLKANGAVLTGRASAMGIESEIKGGKVDGNSFSGQVEGDGPLGHMTLDIQGTVDGDAITGTVKAGRITAKFEGARV